MVDESEDRTGEENDETKIEKSNASSGVEKTVRFESDQKDPEEKFSSSELKRRPRSRSASPIPLTPTPPPDILAEPCVLAAAAASAELRRRKSSSSTEEQQQQQSDQVERTSHL